MFEAEAKERQRAAGEQFGKGHPKVVVDIQQPKAVEVAAAAAGIGSAEPLACR
jgi:hypothetical protein